MHMTRSKQWLEPMHLSRERKQMGIVGILVVGLLVVFGIWVWPELHRTIRIHRM